MKIGPASLSLAALASAALVAPAALADTFEMSPKQGGLNSVQFENEAPFETITGLTNHVVGELKVDLASPSKTSGEIKVKVDTIKTGIAKRDEHLTEEAWLDAKKHPWITFTIDRVETSDGPLEDGKKIKAKVHGKITIKGKTKGVVAPSTITYREVTDESRRAYIDSDVLRVKSLLKLDIRDFGIEPPEHIAGVKVSDEVTVKIALTPARK